MKKIIDSKKILVLILCSVMVLSVGCVSTNSTGDGDWGFSIDLNSGPLEKYTIDETKNYEIKGIEEISVRSISTSVEFFATDEAEIKVHFHGTVETNSDVIPELKVVPEKNELNIKIDRKNSVSVGRHRENLQLDIYLPRKSYEELAVKTVSGQINIDEVQSKEFDLETVSGNIDVGSANTSSTTVGTVSGGVNILGFMGDLRVETVSGKIDIEYSEFQNDIDLNTISGRINIKLPEDAQFGLWAKTTSGRFDLDFPIEMTKDEKRSMEGVVGSKDNEIHVRTVSGNINIYH